MIAERFLRDHPPDASDNDDREIIPVLAVQMPASPTLIRFHAAILAALNSPVSAQGRTLQLESMSLRLLTGVGCRMLIIDELHNLLAATAQRQREMLNLLRFLGNELRIPLICLGTREAYLALRTDAQLENRFQPFVLPLWKTAPNSHACSQASRRCCLYASRQGLARRNCASWSYTVPKASSARLRHC